MSNHIDKIVEALPEGLTETGIEEVAVLLDEVVEDRVAEEVKLLEAKVKAFLRTKLDELKGTAQRELEADNKLVRAYKVFKARLYQSTFSLKNLSKQSIFWNPNWTTERVNLVNLVRHL